MPSGAAPPSQGLVSPVRRTEDVTAPTQTGRLAVRRARLLRRGPTHGTEVAAKAELLAVAVPALVAILDTALVGHAAVRWKQNCDLRRAKPPQPSGANTRIDVHIPETTVLWALACLRHVTKGSRRCIAMALDDKADAVCVGIMRQHPDNWRIQHHCLMVFRSLTYFRADSQLRLVYELHAVPLVLLAMRQYPANAAVQAASFMFLQNVTWLVEQNRDMLKSLGVAELIVAGMRKHRQSCEVARWGCGALQNLACNVDRNDFAFGAMVVGDVLLAMDEHSSDALVQYYGLGVLRNLSYGPASRPSVANARAVDAVIAAMQRHMMRQDVQVNALAYLGNLVVDGRQFRPLLLGHPQLLSTVIRSKQAHAREQAFAVRASSLLETLGPGGCIAAHLDMAEGIVTPLLNMAAAVVMRNVAHEGDNRQTRCLGRWRLGMATTTRWMQNLDALPDEIQELLSKPQACGVCGQPFLGLSHEVACKSPAGEWTLHLCCSPRCVHAVAQSKGSTTA